MLRLTILKRTLTTLFTAALLIGGLGSLQTVHAAPFSFEYNDTISATDIPGLAVGQDAKITVTLDNGGATILSQTWTAAHLQSVTWNFNNGGLVTTFASPFDGGLGTGAGDFMTDAAGTLTTVMTNWSDVAVMADFTTTGSGTDLEWYFDGFNNVYSEVAGRRLVDLTNVGDMLIAANWSQSSPTPTPEPSTMLLLGSGLVGLIGYRMRKQVIE